MSTKIKQFKIVVIDSYDIIGEGKDEFKEYVRSCLVAEDLTVLEIIDLDEKEVPHETT